MNTKYFTKTGKGQLTISQVYCNNREDYIRIQIEDELSGIVFLEVGIDFTSFAKCITSSRSMPIEFGLRNMDRVGKKLEIKHEEILLSNKYILSNEEEELVKIAAILVKPYEVDGWIGRSQDMRNYHNIIKNTKDGTVYKVSFCRWVEV